MSPKLVLLSLAALLIVTGTAHATGAGVGVFGGVSLPVANDLASQGSQFGVRVPVSLGPIVTVEPYYARSALGDVEETFGPTTYTRDGGDVSSFGVNARLFSPGVGIVRFYPFVGLGTNRIEQSGLADLTKLGWNFGLGLGVAPVSRLWIDLRGELQAIVTDQTSRKFTNITLGVSYDLLSLP